VEGRGGKALLDSAPLVLRNRVPRGFCASAVTVWGEYATISINFSLDLAIMTMSSAYALPACFSATISKKTRINGLLNRRFIEYVK
jgi:hypothetical protein